MLRTVLTEAEDRIGHGPHPHNHTLYTVATQNKRTVLTRVVQYGGGMGGTLPHPGVVPPHEDLSLPIPKMLSPPPP